VGILLVVGDGRIATVADDATGRVASRPAALHDLPEHLGTWLSDQLDARVALLAAGIGRIGSVIGDRVGRAKRQSARCPQQHK
jgi:hypothetical protein